MSIFSDAIDFLASIMQQFLSLCYELTVHLGIPSYGIAIIIMTILIKVALLPLAVKQIRSMKGMQELQPRIQQIQKKYKGDPQKQQQEMAKMYQELGINPLSGCLPMLIQMPFLISIFYALRQYQYNPEHMSFLWLPSLGQHDPYYILPVISALSTFIMQKQTMSSNSSGPSATQQKVMMVFMPLFIGYISLKFPSGLVIYWVVSNIFQMVQQFIMFRKSPEGAKS